MDKPGHSDLARCMIRRRRCTSLQDLEIRAANMKIQGTMQDLPRWMPWQSGTRMDDLRAIGNTSVGEFGWTGMMGTYVSIDPAERMSIVYMHNSDPNMEQYVHHRVRNIVYGMID